MKRRRCQCTSPARTIEPARKRVLPRPSAPGFHQQQPPRTSPFVLLGLFLVALASASLLSLKGNGHAPRCYVLRYVGVCRASDALPVGAVCLSVWAREEGEVVQCSPKLPCTLPVSKPAMIPCRLSCAMLFLMGFKADGGLRARVCHRHMSCCIASDCGGRFGEDGKSRLVVTCAALGGLALRDWHEVAGVGAARTSNPPPQMPRKIQYGFCLPPSIWGSPYPALHYAKQ